VGPLPERQGQRPVQKSLGKLIKPSSRAREMMEEEEKKRAGRGGIWGKGYELQKKRRFINK
jgi:hypothetical protein